jgi:branched-chain amino acid transport system ATP-binding protein
MTAAVAQHEALAADDVHVRFAGVVALDGVSLKVERGEVVGLIGPNGSGKTTCLNALSGFVRPSEGRVVLDGRDVSRWTPARRARGGLTRTFQGVRAFAALSVLENVEVAGLGAGLGRRAARRRAGEILARLELEPLAATPAGAVSTGDERRVGIARALATEPRYLLLDEPAAGLNDAESERLIATIRSLAEEFECGVLLVEHDMAVVMGTCARLHVLDTGRTIAEGAPAQVAADSAVVAAYFGAEAAA